MMNLSSKQIQRTLVVTCILMVNTLLVFAQAKQMVQIKTFDLKLNAYKNLELTLNGTIQIKTNEKGVTFAEMSEAELPIRSIDVKNEELEVASWNFTKGVIEIIVRKKNYQLVTVSIVDEQQQPIQKADVSFSGSRKLLVKTTAEGQIQLPLAPDERIISPSQFSIKGFQSENVTGAGGNYTLTIERIPPPEPVTRPVETQPEMKTYELEVANLDSVRTLGGFYKIVRDMPMDALNEAQKRKIDLKFNELLAGIRQTADPGQPVAVSITDSTLITDDIKLLMERALAERNLLESQRDEFDTRIKSLERKLSGGIADMDDATRDRLLSDILSLEILLNENQRRFDENQAEYQRIINSLKERYFDTKLLEQKLTAVETLRQEEQREFRRKIIYVTVALVIFVIMLVLLARSRDTLRKQKTALTLANEEIRKINENLEERVASRTKLLQEAIVELDTFLYRASHDLRTPVASIEGVCNLTDHISKEEFVELVKRSTERMNKLLKNLSVISEINQPTNPVPVALRDVVSRVVSRFQKALEKQNTQLLVVCPDTVILRTYAVFLEVIIAKLLENAIFFTALNAAEKSPVIQIIVTRKDDRTVNLTVEDNGAGIDKDVMPRIFEMFFKGHEKSKGSGLGLYIVSRCLRLMKGKATVTSGAGVTQVSIELPELPA